MRELLMQTHVKLGSGSTIIVLKIEKKAINFALFKFHSHHKAT
jgi:hypothetical protein